MPYKEDARIIYQSKGIQTAYSVRRTFRSSCTIQVLFCHVISSPLLAFQSGVTAEIKVYESEWLSEAARSITTSLHAILHKDLPHFLRRKLNYSFSNSLYRGIRHRTDSVQLSKGLRLEKRSLTATSDVCHLGADYLVVKL
jgi:hypothetical protein